MFAINLKTLILLLAACPAFAGHDVTYAQVEAARYSTARAVEEIKQYNVGLKEKVEYFKSYCQSDVALEGAQACINTLTYIETRMYRMDMKLNYLGARASSFPAELGNSAQSLQSAVAKFRSNISSISNTLVHLKKAFEKKTLEAFNLAKQKVITKGVVKGNSLYYCSLFNPFVKNLASQFDVHVAKNADVSEYFINYRLLLQYQQSAKLYQEQCPGKMDFVESEKVLKKYSGQISEQKISAYLKKACPRVQDSVLKEQCLEPGIKKVDLFYTLFSLKKAGSL